MKPKPLSSQAVERILRESRESGGKRLAAEMLLEGVLANSHRYKPEPLLATTGKGFLAPTTPADVARDRRVRKKLLKQLGKPVITKAVTRRYFDEMRAKRLEEFVPGHRVTVEDVMDAYRQSKSFTKTAEHFELSKSDVRFVVQMEQARRRGDKALQKIVWMEGGSLSADEVALTLGMSRATVLRRRRQNRLLAWDIGFEPRFPAWQFHNGAPLGLAPVLKVFAHRGIWGQTMFFLSPRKSWQGKRPLDVLRAGDKKLRASVLALARSDLLS